MDFPTRRKGGGERVSLVNFFFSSSLSLSSLLSSKRERCVNYRSSFLSSAGGSIFVSHRDFRRPVSRNACGKLVEILFILTFVPLRFANIGDKWTREGCCRRRDLYFFSFSLFYFYLLSLLIFHRGNGNVRIRIRKRGTSLSSGIENKTGRGCRENFRSPLFRFRF